MCDQDHLSTMPKINRRQFGALGAAGAVAACAPMATTENVPLSGLAENAVTFDAPGGTFDGVFIHPASGSHPAVILWPDIAGLRPAKLAMGRRLAQSGFAVLVANPYYRSVAGQQFEDFEAWRNGGGFDTVRPWMAANTPTAIAETAQAVVAWLDEQDAVDSSRGIGNQGYCMTGSWTIRAAAAVPRRIKAAASFHGGGLVGEGPDAPVNLLSAMASDAAALIAIARNDDAQAPTDKDALMAAAQAAAADIHVEVYDADHGWTVYDSPVYDEPEAERAWAALLGDVPRDALVPDAGMADARVLDATGRDWAAWKAHLDAVGAGDMDHAAIARMLKAEGVQPWWCQMVTVGYERMIGRREVGQTCTGTFAANVSKTFPGDKDAALAAWQQLVGERTDFADAVASEEPRVDAERQLALLARRSRQWQQGYGPLFRQAGRQIGDRGQPREVGRCRSGGGGQGLLEAVAATAVKTLRKIKGSACQRG